MSLPTDCDQRDERLGWMGDADLSADSFALNYDSGDFMSSFMRSMVDAQNPSSGALPDVVPFQRFGNQPADPSWSAALPQNMFVRYSIGGDLSPARDNWNAGVLYMSNLAAQLKAAGGLAKWTASYGDWVPAASPKVSTQVTNAFNYIVNSDQMSQLANALGDKGNATAFANLRDSLRQQFHTAFYNSTTKCYDVCNQAAMALALGSGSVPASLQKDILQKLVTDITTTQSNHITTGIIGAKALFPVLSKMGQQAVAVSLAEQVTYPSWGYMFHNNLENATSSLWELWNGPTQGPGMNSRNHHMFSSISAWFVQYLAGLQSVSCSARTAHVRLGATSLRSTHVQRTLPCGSVAVDFERHGGKQCAVVPEGARDVVSCGSSGGAIEEVLFASYGSAKGGCAAGFSATADCHHASSLAAVKAACLGKASCDVSAEPAFWAGRGASPVCPQLVPYGERRHLAVSVRCSEPATGHAAIKLPLGVVADVTLDTAAGETVSVTDNGLTATYTSEANALSADGLRAVQLRGVRGHKTLSWALE